MSDITTRNDAIRALARERFDTTAGGGIDDDAKISEGDNNGAYVQAWVWVPFSGTELDKEIKEV